jgi:hypothetical protein
MPVLSLPKPEPRNDWCACTRCKSGGKCTASVNDASRLRVVVRNTANAFHCAKIINSMAPSGWRTRLERGRTAMYLAP